MKMKTKMIEFEMRMHDLQKIKSSLKCTQKHSSEA